MQKKHKYVLLFGGISVFYLLIMILVGNFKEQTTNAANRIEYQQAMAVVSDAPIQVQALEQNETEKTQTVTEKAAVKMAVTVEGSPVPKTSSEPAAASPAASPLETAVPTVVPTAMPTLNPIFNGYRNISQERRNVVNLAKSFVGKITYLWGGKPTNADIKGKTDPTQLDCSGFVQFVYSRVLGKRQDSIGATVSIANLKKINKSELKPGDIGLKNGTGSLYYDVDGNAYSEPGYAEVSNTSHVETAKAQIASLEAEIAHFYEVIEEKKEALEIWKERRRILYKRAKKIGITGVDEEDKTTFVAEETDDKKILKLRKRYQEMYKHYLTKMKDIRAYIVTLREKKAEDVYLIKENEAVIKKYDKDIIRKIDHVGIYCGKDKNGRKIWCHCSSSGHGVKWESTDKFQYYFTFFDD